MTRTPIVEVARTFIPHGVEVGFRRLDPDGVEVG